MVKRDLSKEFLPSSSSTSSADTIVNVAMRKKFRFMKYNIVSLLSLNIVLFLSMIVVLCFFKGERDGPLYFVDSSKAPTPASRYGGYSIYHTELFRFNNTIKLLFTSI